MQFPTSLSMTAHLLVLMIAGQTSAQDREPADAPLPYLTTAQPMTLLSANDGELRFLHTTTGAEQHCVMDSFTVIHLGPDHPPLVQTVAGTVPVTIHGSPHLAISHRGRYGFMANHGWRGEKILKGNQQPVPAEHLKNVLSVVDLTLERPIVTQRLRQVGDGLESLAFHPSGRFAVVTCLDKGPDVLVASHLATVDLTCAPGAVAEPHSNRCAPLFWREPVGHEFLMVGLSSLRGRSRRGMDGASLPSSE